MVWDATSPDTFAPSYLQSATSAAGAVAALADNRKKGKYGCLDSTYTFAPIAIESSGTCGPLTMGILRDQGSRLKLTTGEENSIKYLLQRLPVAVQRGNSASVLGTTAHPSSGCIGPESIGCSQSTLAGPVQCSYSGPQWGNPQHATQ